MAACRFTECVVLTAVIAALAGCGGGGGGGGGDTSGGGGGGGTPPSGTTVFAGGSLDDLKALSSNLTFDDLQITGTLSLPVYSSATITANKLTITSSGRIGYSYTTCQYVDAPGVTFNSSGDVVIDGEINLPGRSGTTITETASCNSCYGQDGGNVAINGKTIRVRGKISNYGGAGASIHWSTGGSSPCSAGASGTLRLAATGTVGLSGASIDNHAGKNFEGTQASSGAATVSSGGAFTMQNGGISSTGALTFSAASTDIWGTITYGSLSETIGGLPDTSKPSVTVTSPLPNAAIPWHQPLQVTLQASDVGMGLKSVQIKGLGHDKTYTLADFVGSTLTATISAPDLPETLDAIATDNKGNTNTVSVAGLTIHYPAEAEPNDSLATAQALALGGIIEGHIVNGDAGATWTSGAPSGLYLNKSGVAKIEDFYKVTCCKTWTCGSWPWTYTCYGVTVTLDFTQSAAATPDLDLYLLDTAGSSVLASSVKDNVATSGYTESISYTGFTSSDMGKIYYLGVQAWDAPSDTSYRIKFQ